MTGKVLNQEFKDSKGREEINSHRICIDTVFAVRVSRDIDPHMEVLDFWGYVYRL